MKCPMPAHFPFSPGSQKGLGSGVAKRSYLGAGEFFVKGTEYGR